MWMGAHIFSILKHFKGNQNVFNSDMIDLKMNQNNFLPHFNWLKLMSWIKVVIKFWVTDEMRINFIRLKMKNILYQDILLKN